MFTIVDKSIRTASTADTTEISACPDKVYDAWIKRVHKNKTPVRAGDTYIWLFVQVLPPKVVNCYITVKEGDDYPPKSASGTVSIAEDPLTG